MCSRLFLLYIFLISCYMNISLAQNFTENSYDIKILQQNIKFAEMEKHISEQDRTIEHQNVRFAEQDREMAVLGSFTDQNRQIAELRGLIERQNTKFAEQNTLITEQNVKLCELKSQIQMLQQRETSITSTQSPVFSNDTGVIFTRWGRSDCPRSTTQVYNGTTGGGSHEHQGSSVNYVCMPHEPLYNENKHYGGGSWAYLFGSEYESGPRSGLYQYEVPCAVCRATPYSTKLMIPGRNKCYHGWQEAYHGELKSGYHGHKAASEYICLDEHAQRTGKNNNDNGVLLYPVRTQCGSLPCPPYEHNTLLTCVVCIK